MQLAETKKRMNNDFLPIMEETIDSKVILNHLYHSVYNSVFKKFATFGSSSSLRSVFPSLWPFATLRALVTAVSRRHFQCEQVIFSMPVLTGDLLRYGPNAVTAGPDTVTTTLVLIAGAD
ncbi:hypothetical protein KFK09_001571 [Dendrobium nobile]|uniref:Uncharacterized protein n=1 Tax=Dendrobium nobile TaxID=94219 RepID=A0A8T3C580_DENNO|nr:hypothetical protein KFK09_001571 [Dendrobium nobile]